MFVRDLLRLEEIHLALAEWPSPIATENIGNDILHEYGTLLECLAPARAFHPIPWGPVNFVFPELEREARLFSLMTSDEERHFREVLLRQSAGLFQDGDRPHRLPQRLERVVRDRRLAFMISQEVYHRYFETTEGVPDGGRDLLPVGREQGRRPPRTVAPLPRQVGHNRNRRPSFHTIPPTTTSSQAPFSWFRTASLDPILLRPRATQPYNVQSDSTRGIAIASRSPDTRAYPDTQRDGSTVVTRRERRRESNHRHPELAHSVDGEEGVD